MDSRVVCIAAVASRKGKTSTHDHLFSHLGAANKSDDVSAGFPLFYPYRERSG